MFTTPEIQSKMKVVSAGPKDAGAINFLFSDIPHRGVGRPPVAGKITGRKVIHMYVFDAPYPHGYFFHSILFFLFSEH